METKLYVVLLLLSVCLTGNDAVAQDGRIQEKPRYVIETDSQFIKATPYERVVENGMEVHRYAGGEAEWYTDMTVYRFLPRDLDEKGSLMKSSIRKPTIFLLSGGGFVKLDNQAQLNPNNGSLAAHPNLKLAAKLANEGYNVFWIDYQVATGSDSSSIEKLFINPLLIVGCTYTNGTKSKAILEYTSLASFSDFRKKFRTEIDTNSVIDTNNVFVAGISAGAVLTIYSVFLESHEIPNSLSYANCSNPPTINTINTAHLKTVGYPIPKIKGIIPMSGGSLYDNIFNHTSHSDSAYINLMHGTCDELINQDQGRIAYKNLRLLPPGIVYNNFDLIRYPYVYGSRYLYNLIKATHGKIGFGQVIRGGHNVIDSSVLIAGGWDVYEKNNSLSKYNPRDIVFDNISYFMKRAMGESGYPAWTNHAYSVFPDIPTDFCLTDDQTLIVPPIITVDSVCGTVSATVSNPPAWATFSWTVSPNLQIVGSSTGSAISYKSLSTGSGWVRVSVNYGGGGAAIPITKNVLVPATCPTPCNGILYYDNQTVGINTNIIHCGHIHSQNVAVNSGVSLVLDATGYVLIPSNFEVPVGATLDLNP